MDPTDLHAHQVRRGGPRSPKTAGVLLPGRTMIRHASQPGAVTEIPGVVTFAHFIDPDGNQIGLTKG